MKKIKLLVAALIMVCFTLQVPAIGGSVTCGGIGVDIDSAESGCDPVTSTIFNHVAEGRIFYDDYFYFDGINPAVTDYGYLTEGAEDEICNSVGNPADGTPVALEVQRCHYAAEYTLHHFIDDTTTYYSGPCE